MSVARFWRETLRRYNLGGNRCTECGKVHFPPRAVCPHCATHRKTLGRLEPVQLSGEGEVFSFSVVHEAAEGFEMQVPYLLALVKMREGPILTAQLVDVDPKEVTIGMPVKAAFRKLKAEGPDGVIHYGYKFAPVLTTTEKVG